MALSGLWLLACEPGEPSPAGKFASARVSGAGEREHGLRASAGGFEAWFDERRAWIGEPVGALGLSLARIGCDDRRLVDVERSPPRAMNNRVAYSLRAGSTSVEETFIALPSGLEQTFSVDSEMCRDSRALVLDVHVEGGELSSHVGGSLRLTSGEGARYDYSGLFVADATGRVLSSRMVAENSETIRIHVDVGDASFPVLIDPLIALLDAQLVRDDPAAEDRFGSAVAVDGDIAVLGAPLDDHSGLDAPGSAYVFVRNGGQWTQEAQLIASDPENGAYFGYGVALSGDTAVVGDWNGTATYVFVRDQGVWSEQAQLIPSDVGTFSLRAEVAVEGDTAIVGAPFQDSPAGANAGAAYIFTRSGSTWTEQAKLVEASPGVDRQFGAAVSISGDSALIGVTRNNQDVTPQGKAYVFVRAAGVWTEQAALVPDDGKVGDFFGDAVSISGDTALIGAWGFTSGSDVRTGHAYFFSRSGTTWGHEATFAGAGDHDLYGSSVMLQGTSAVIGVPGGFVAPNTGYVDVVVRENGLWTKQIPINPGPAPSNPEFGQAVALSASTVIGGAPLDIAQGIFSGAAYAFVLSPQKDEGEDCSLDGECLSGSCADGVCCNDWCMNECETCTAAEGAVADGTCSPTSGDSCMDGVCVDGTCNTEGGGGAGGEGAGAEGAGGPGGSPSAGANAGGAAVATGGGGASSSGGSNPGGESAGEDDGGGCDCRMRGPSNAAQGWLVPLLALAIAARKLRAR